MPTLYVVLLNLFELYAGNIPSLNFALDFSLYDILAKKEKISLAKYLNPNNVNQIKFSSIYNQEVNKSFKVIKVKFGMQNIDDDITALYGLLNQYDENVKFRIDANQAYNVEEFLYLPNISSLYVFLISSKLFFSLFKEKLILDLFIIFAAL